MSNGVPPVKSMPLWVGETGFNRFIERFYMPKKIILLCALLIVLLVMTGCSSRKTAVLKPPPAKAAPRLIAVLPTINHVADPMIGTIVRQRAIDELYFKGYPKIPAGTIDEKLDGIYGNKTIASEGIPPATIGELTGADAVLYCTIRKIKTSYRFMYAPTQVELSFDMRSAKTGATIWQARHSVSEKNFGFTRRELEMKSFQGYEAAIGEIFEKVMKTLPDGPDVTG